jgi:hypothetical protein
MSADPSRIANSLTLEQFGPATTGLFLLDWLDSRRSLRPSTRLAYEIHLRRYLLPHLGAMPLTDLTVVDLERMYQALLGGNTKGVRLACAACMPR